jgi:hypothetical protein
MFGSRRSAVRATNQQLIGKNRQLTSFSGNSATTSPPRLACQQPNRLALPYPVRNPVGEFIEGFPCNVIGHYCDEIPRPLRRRKNDGHRMRFKCSRCVLMGGSI